MTSNFAPVCTTTMTIWLYSHRFSFRMILLYVVRPTWGNIANLMGWISTRCIAAFGADAALIECGLYFLCRCLLGATSLLLASRQTTKTNVLARMCRDELLPKDIHGRYLKSRRSLYYLSLGRWFQIRWNARCMSHRKRQQAARGEEHPWTQACQSWGDRMTVDKIRAANVESHSKLDTIYTIYIHGFILSAR